MPRYGSNSWRLGRHGWNVTWSTWWIICQISCGWSEQKLSKVLVSMRWQLEERVGFINFEASVPNVLVFLNIDETAGRGNLLMLLCFTGNKQATFSNTSILSKDFVLSPRPSIGFRRTQMSISLVAYCTKSPRWRRSTTAALLGNGLTPKSPYLSDTEKEIAFVQSIGRISNLFFLVEGDNWGYLLPALFAYLVLHTTRGIKSNHGITKSEKTTWYTVTEFVRLDRPRFWNI